MYGGYGGGGPSPGGGGYQNPQMTGYMQPQQTGFNPQQQQQQQQQRPMQPMQPIQTGMPGMQPQMTGMSPMGMGMGMGMGGGMGMGMISPMGMQQTGYQPQQQQRLGVPGMGPQGRMGPGGGLQPQATGYPGGGMGGGLMPQATGMMPQATGMMPQMTGMPITDPRLRLMSQQFAPAQQPYSGGYATPSNMNFSSASMQPSNFQSTIQSLSQQQQGTPEPRIPWALSKEEKRSYDKIFRAWDAKGTGFINANVAREVFGQSGLEQDKLMQIWHLCDTNNRGKLNLAEFHVAMGLVYRGEWRSSFHTFESQLTLSALQPSMATKSHKSYRRI